MPGPTLRDGSGWGPVRDSKGGDWSEENVVGRQSVRKWGGKVVIIPETKGASTTNIVEKIIKTYGRP